MRQCSRSEARWSAQGWRRSIAVLVGTGLAVSVGLAVPSSAAPVDELEVTVEVTDGLLGGAVDGRVVVMFAPADRDPLWDTGVESPNKIFGLNVADLDDGETVTLAGGDLGNADTGVVGYPTVSLSDLPAGDYRVQAFFTPYETVTRSDGSTVSLRFPCGDGGVAVNAPGSLTTAISDVTVRSGAQRINLSFSSRTAQPVTGTSEIGGCSQGNYEDTATHKHLKIRSDALSEFWGRDMYVGANVTLPHGYDPADTSKRYPVLYVQSHWPGDGGGFGYPYDTWFAERWDRGVVEAYGDFPEREVPEMILVTIRHESPYYDDSYGVNSANLGPWGDAINDELVPAIDDTFNTIAEPYGRIQEGGSTGGWIAVANTVLRPDLYGAAFAYYPDSLNFHQQQDIDLYNEPNAYRRADGSSIFSIRSFPNGVESPDVTVAQENHWEQVYGTSSRSFLQWDVWNTVFGVQGLNGYPLEPWNKSTGEVYPGAVELWRPMDMGDYVTQNWDGSRNLGEALRGRLHISVGDRDNYYLDGGVQEFKDDVEALGGQDWAEIDIQPGVQHGGFYQNRDLWNYLELVETWVADHAPDGVTPLSDSATAPTTRGNQWNDVIADGGHKAALDRQSDPTIAPAATTGDEATMTATVGTWDPGVELAAQWFANDAPVGPELEVDAGATPELRLPLLAQSQSVQLRVTGTKSGYVTETRRSNLTTVTPSPESVFVDVPRGTLFYNDIAWLSTRGISQGWVDANGNREFRPTAPIARDAMAAFLYRNAGSPTFTPPVVSPFTDVSTSNQFYKEIAWLADQEISTGWANGDGTFAYRPLDAIGRDAMAAFLYRAAGEPSFTAPTVSPFDDLATSTQFYQEIAWLRDEGIATGWVGNDGTAQYRPGNPINRDAMAAFLHRYVEAGHR